MRVLGLDIGTSSIKAIEIETRFNSHSIVDYYEEVIQADEAPAAAAARLIHGLKHTPDRIGVAFPPSVVTFRTLTVPSKDRKAMQAAIQYELEDDLPFGDEDILFAYSKLNQMKGTAQVHIAVTLKKHVEKFLGELKESGIDPDVVTTEAWAYAVLLKKIFKNLEPPEPVLLVQMGDKKSTLHVHWRGTPLFSNELAWGGYDLTLAIQKKYGVSLEEAQKAKIDNGFVLASHQREKANPEQIEFSDMMESALKPLLLQIRQAELAARNYSQLPLSQILLSGGTSLLPGIKTLIEEHTRTPVSMLKALSGTDRGKVDYSEHTDSLYGLATALALCLTQSERSTLINLRKDEFAKASRSIGFNFEAFKTPALTFAVVSLVMGASLYIQNSYYSEKLETTDKALERSMETLLGQKPTPSQKNKYLANPGDLRIEAKKKLDRKREMAVLAKPHPHFPLEVIKNLSKKVPGNLSADLLQVQVGAAPEKPYDSRTLGKASFTFVLSKKEDVETLKKKLGDLLETVDQSPLVDVAVSGSSEKKVKVTFSGIPKEDSYGR